MSHLTYPEAGLIGLIQRVTELFPISSLGHSVLIPALIGGSPGTGRKVLGPDLRLPALDDDQPPGLAMWT
jgi:hypothetical protein